MTQHEHTLQASATMSRRGTSDVVTIDVGDGRTLEVRVDQANGRTIAIDGRNVLGSRLYHSADNKLQQWGRA